MKLSNTRIKRSILLTLVLPGAIGLLILTTMLSRPHTPTRDANRTQASDAALSQARETYGRIPLSFEANRGQTEASVNFLARGAGYALFLQPTEATFVLQNADFGMRDEIADTASLKTDNPQSASHDPQSAVLRMKLVGANAKAAGAGADELAGKVNYFTGDDPARWRTDVPTFERVRYGEVYPGIDMVYYGNQRQLEYDFVVAPGRDPRAVRLQFEGADKVTVDAGGDLLLTVGENTIRQPKPIIYQEVAGVRRAVEGGYAVEGGGRVGFAVGGYDAALPLVIDPTLVYSTYLGGSNTDLARAIAVDPSGNAYITGYTTSSNFPTANAFQASLNGTAGGFGNRDAFVTKINAAGTALVYSTYLGGSGGEEARGIAVDSSGNAYVAGFTSSTDFPTANALQATKGATNEDAFVTKINAAGSALVYSTYLGGGESSEFGEAIAVDSSGNAYVTGSTFSDNFPTVNPIQATFGGGSTDAFVTKINAAGSAIVYSTYLGGSGMADSTQPETGFGIAADSSGNAYVTGETNSDKNFPLANAIQGTFGGGVSDAFVTKINADGSAFIYSSYLGGSTQDAGEGIKADADGNTYVAGFTTSANFPTANAFQAANAGGSGSQDAFVTKINPTGSALVYSTYFGGAGGEIAFGIAVDASGNVYLGGSTGSTNTFPVANAIQCARNGGQDLFVTKFNAAGSALLYSTYLGGSGSDDGQGIALDPSNNVYVAGSTTSTDFPTVNPIQSTNSGGSPFGDAFVAKLSDALSPNACATPTPTPTPTPIPTPTPSPTPTPAPTPQTFQFSAGVFVNPEGIGQAAIFINRAGDNSTPATVDFATAPDAATLRCDTVNGTASERCDFTTRIATVRFAPGETQKVVLIFLTDDVYVEGDEDFTVSLSNPTGGPVLGSISSALVRITDNDAAPTSANPIDTASFFVRMHYIDFLNREGEQPGFDNWVNALNNCPSGNQLCDRVGVSSSFFRSDEFMLKGNFVIRFYKLSFNGYPLYRPFMRDSQRVTANTAAEVFAARDAFTNEWVERADFKAIFDGLSNQGYVDRLEQNAGVTLSNKAQLVADLNAGTKTRAQVLRDIVESNEVKAKMYNDAFVLMEYFGYLRRDPDADGFQKWLVYLNAHPSDFRTMVRGFINSVEYRIRFGTPGPPLPGLQ